MTVYTAAASSRLLDWELDDDIIETQELAVLADQEGLECFRLSWYGNFKFDQYDWGDPEFTKWNTGPEAYRVIPLTQGYFMIVSPHDYKHMTQFPDGTPKNWRANVQRDRETQKIKGIYAVRHGHRDEPSCVYAHREVVGCLFGAGVVDHKNGWGLDNRRGTQKHPVNLQYTSGSENNHNALRFRATSLVLPRGVELRRKNKKGQQLYGGMYCKRSGKKVRTVRSKCVWLTPELASRWYQKQMKRLHQQRTAWAHDPESVRYPEFPRFVPGLIPF